jgi:exopolysaccharide biosynthesis polyprenyl glycosylphosphotransferase
MSRNSEGIVSRMKASPSSSEWVAAPDAAPARWDAKVDRAVRFSLESAAKHLVRAKKSRWMLYDAIAASAALGLGYALSPREAMGAPIHHMALFAAACVVAGNVAGLYDRQVFLSRVKLAVALAAATTLGAMGAAICLHVLLLAPAGRWVWALAGPVFFFAASLPRAITHWFPDAFLLRVLFVGDPNEGGALTRFFGAPGHRRAHCHWTASIGGDSLDSISQRCRDLGIDEIVVAESYLPRRDALERCFEACRHGVVVRSESAFVEEISEQVPVEHINESWFYSARFGCWSHAHLCVKRMVDIAASASGLMILSPAMAVIWLLTRATSPGPGLYSQIRAGRYGEPFRIYKFRTMTQDAEKNGAEWAREADPRVTGLGRLLRKTRLDELPQLWNVLRGDMSLVGPRPERPELIREIEKEVPYFVFRQWMRPGLTGLAQIRHGYGGTVEDARIKLRHDLYYIKNFNILLDFQIILRTIAVIARGSR